MQTATSIKNYGIKDLIPCKGFLAKLIGAVISVFGDNLDAVAYSWMVYVMTGSKLLMGTLFAVKTIPKIVFGPFAGVFVDRLPKNKLLIVCSIAKGIFAFLIALLFLLNLLKPWHLFIFTFLTACFESFEGPASASMFSLILPKELFLTANSVESSMTTIAQLVGLAAAGLIIAILGISGAIFINSFTFFINAILVYFIKIEKEVLNTKPFTYKSYLSDLKTGFDFVIKNNLIRTVILLFAFANFCVIPFTLFQSVYVKDVLHQGPYVLSILGVVATVGMILGGLFVGQYGSRFKNSQLVITGFCSFGILYMSLFIPGITSIDRFIATVITTAIFFATGFFFVVAGSPIRIYLMKNTPGELMGRVQALFGTCALCTIPLSSVLSGVVTEYIEIPTYFLIMGILMTLAALSLLRNKEFMSA